MGDIELGVNDTLDVLPGGRKVLYRDGNHSYYLIDGEDKTRLTSVTTLTGKVTGGSADGLMEWAAKLAREGKDWREERNKSAVTGTSVHAALEALAQGTVPDLADFPDEDEKNLVLAISSWWLDAQPVVEKTEFVVAHPGLEYAGRCDLLCRLDDELWIIDLKTSKSVGSKKFPKVAYHAQLGLYMLAMQELGMEVPQRAGILHVTRGGDWRLLESVVRPEHVLAIPVVVKQLRVLEREQRESE
jgi:RecB family exonuclease